MTGKPRVLVVCTGNSMRSQLAEGVLRAELGKYIDVYSAGVSPSAVHPLTIAALEEAQIDASKCRAKSVKEFVDLKWDLVITLCDGARRVCPRFPRARKTMHHGYPDPLGSVGMQSAAAVFADLREQMRVELVELVVKELRISRDNLEG